MKTVLGIYTRTVETSGDSDRLGTGRLMVVEVISYIDVSNGGN
jgi:hypothetical protein